MSEDCWRPGGSAGRRTRTPFAMNSFSCAGVRPGGAAGAAIAASRGIGRAAREEQLHDAGRGAVRRAARGRARAGSAQLRQTRSCSSLKAQILRFPQAVNSRSVDSRRRGEATICLLRPPQAICSCPPPHHASRGETTPETRPAVGTLVTAGARPGPASGGAAWGSWHTGRRGTFRNACRRGPRRPACSLGGRCGARGKIPES